MCRKMQSWLQRLINRCKLSRPLLALEPHALCRSLLGKGNSVHRVWCSVTTTAVRAMVLAVSCPVLPPPAPTTHDRERHAALLLRPHTTPPLPLNSPAMMPPPTTPPTVDRPPAARLRCLAALPPTGRIVTAAPWSLPSMAREKGSTSPEP